MERAALIACASVLAVREGMVGWSMDFIASLKSCLSSLLSMASMFVPMSRTPRLSRKPLLCSSMARLRPVWPPSPASRLSGFSFSIMRSTVRRVSGSMYTAVAMSGSVMMVAGLEFMRTVSTPSAMSARQAWVPA